MRLAATSELLARCDVLCTLDCGAGFSLWMPYGMAVAARLHRICVAELSAELPLIELDTPTFVDRDEYVRSVSASFDYTNMFSTESANGAWLVKADNIAMIAEHLRADARKLPVLVQGPIYRSESDGLRPLVRDRHVAWTMQLCQLVDADVEVKSRAILDAFRRILASLCIPAIFVENPPIRQHSARGCYAYVFPDEREMTLSATFFELSRPFCDALSLGGTLLDLGFTGKLIAIAAALHADGDGLVLPAALAPTMVAIGTRSESDRSAAQELHARLTAAGIRAELADGSWRQVSRRHTRRGTPLRLLVDQAAGHRLIARVDRTSTAVTADCLPDVRAALERHDHALWQRAQSVRTAAFESAVAARVAPLSASTGTWFPLGPIAGWDSVSGFPARSEADQLWSPRKRLY